MLVKYKCNLCPNSITKYFKDKQEMITQEGIRVSPADNRAPFLNCECGGVMERQLPDFGMSSFEVVDNGSMAKKVELRKDAILKGKEKGDIYIKTMKERDMITKKRSE